MKSKYFVFEFIQRALTYQAEICNIVFAEDEEGHHEPVAVIGTIKEAKELAEKDLFSRMTRLERGDDPGICPYTYKVWARGINGDYRIAYEIEDVVK